MSLLHASRRIEPGCQMSGDWRQQLDSGLQTLDGELPAGAAERLAAYIELLAKWNRAYNLTAVRDPAQMVSRHVLDSLSVRPFLHGTRVLDIGTGAGLPGIPLAIVEPGRHFVLLDGNGKKTRFCIQAAAELGLGNVEVERIRAQDYRPAAGFDTVISRAFSEASAFAAAALPMLAPGGRMLAMKGAYPHTELATLPEAVHLRAVHPLAIPGLDARRHLVELEAIT